MTSSERKQLFDGSRGLYAIRTQPGSGDFSEAIDRFEAMQGNDEAVGDRQGAEETLQALPPMVGLRLTNSASVLMTFLFDQTAKQRRSKGSTHPVAYDRLRNLVRTMASNLAESNGPMRQVFAHTVLGMDRLHQCLLQVEAGSRVGGCGRGRCASLIIESMPSTLLGCCLRLGPRARSVAIR